MALMECPECGKVYSDKVQACPNCAYPNFNFFKNNQNEHVENSGVQENDLSASNNISLNESSSSSVPNDAKYESKSFYIIVSVVAFCLIMTMFAFFILRGLNVGSSPERVDEVCSIRNPFFNTLTDLKLIHSKTSDYLFEGVTIGPLKLITQDYDRESMRVVLVDTQKMKESNSCYLYGNSPTEIEVFYDGLTEKEYSKWFEFNDNTKSFYVKGVVNMYSNNLKPYIDANDIRLGIE